MSNPKVRIGGLVRCSGIWKNMVGLVAATHHDVVEVNNCIVDRKDIHVIARGVIPERFRRYLRR